MSSKSPNGALALEIVGRGPGYLFARHHNVLIAIWTAQGTGPLVDALDRASAPLVRQHPEGFSSIHVVAKGTPLATGEARERLVALMKRYQGQIACIGTVLEGSGFWASATRSLILGMRLLAPQSFEMQTYASIPELAAWLPGPHGKRTGVALDPQELERVVTNLRREADAPS